MSEQRIVVETACGHTQNGKPWWGRHITEHDPAGNTWCTGVSRRIVELPDMEKLRERLTQIGPLIEPINGVPYGTTISADDALVAAARWVLSLESE